MRRRKKIEKAMGGKSELRSTVLERQMLLTWIGTLGRIRWIRHGTFIEFRNRATSKPNRILDPLNHRVLIVQYLVPGSPSSFLHVGLLY